MSFPRRSLLALPFTRLELPGWGRVARALGILGTRRQAEWDSAPTLELRGKVHGYLMELDLSDWAERTTWFLGRYYERTLQDLLADVLAPGDRFVDVGGNIGMITLLAARRVGREGHVDTFEPNPTCLERLKRTLGRNALTWVDVHPFGLSDRVETLTLSVVSDHTGVGTFAPLDGAEHDVTERMDLRLLPGDSVLLRDPRPIKLMKIDVEGFEVRALRGLAGVLRRDRPLVVTEVVELQLRRAGSSTEELFETLRAHGYAPFGLSLPRTGLRRRLRLSALDGPEDAAGYNDVLWCHRDSAAAAALEPRVAPQVTRPAA